MANNSNIYNAFKMKNIFQISLEGNDTNDADGIWDANELESINKQIEAKVMAIIEKLKASKEKFVDEDFGPSSTDALGTHSLYGSVIPPSSPAPDTLKWLRPHYVSDSSPFSKQDHFCEKGQLFLDGSSSGDVIQGQLGDCWFLGAIALLGAKENLLNNCFWRGDSFKDYGLYVLRFFKDTNIQFVVIDDRLPVKQKTNKLVFASCKDPNELWVPLLEKAYAKLHGCYKALIGGYAHFALGDLTGYCPRLMVLKPGYPGFSEPYSDTQIWSLLKRYKQWNCLMGCSIQANNKDVKVEAEAALGLHYGHAYSLLDLGEISLKPEDSKSGLDNRLVKCRNPWGKGEWAGAFSDNSPQRTVYNSEIVKVFKNESDHESLEIKDDGTFFMPFNEWNLNYTTLFSVVSFPSTWRGRKYKGEWSGEVGNWFTNPKIKIRLSPMSKNGVLKPGDLREVYISIYFRDSKPKEGGDGYRDNLSVSPVGFDAMSESDYNNFIHPPKGQPITIRPPAHKFGTSSLDFMVKVDEDYLIIPSLYKLSKPGIFFVTVYCDVEDFSLKVVEDKSGVKIAPVAEKKENHTQAAAPVPDQSPVPAESNESMPQADESAAPETVKSSNVGCFSCINILRRR